MSEGRHETGAAMSREQVMEVVEEHIHDLRAALGLWQWTIAIEYGPASEERWAANCDRSAGNYNQATITIDPAAHFIEVGVVRTLVHELLHIVLARFDVYRAAAAAGGLEGRSEQVVWEHVLEQTVVALTDGLARPLWDPAYQAEDAPT